MYQEEAYVDGSTGARLRRGRRSWWRLVPVISAAVVLVVVVPALETNDSHLFNPDWSAHARLHEAWQLLTNASLGVAAAWLALTGRGRLGAGIGLLVLGPLLAAYASRGLYGGSLNRHGGEDALFSSAGAPVILLALIAAGLVAVLGAKTPTDRE